MNDWQEVVLLALELEGGRMHSVDGRCLADLEMMVLGEERPVGSSYRSPNAREIEIAVTQLEASGHIWVVRRNEKKANRGNWVETIRLRTSHKAPQQEEKS